MPKELVKDSERKMVAIPMKEYKKIEPYILKNGYIAGVFFANAALEKIERDRQLKQILDANR